MALRRPRALLLDLDGTLLDTPVGRDAARAATAAIVEEETGIRTEEWARAESEIARDVWARVGDDWILGRIPTRDVSQSILSATLARTGAPDALASRLLDVWPSASRAASALYPDARPLVEFAKQRGIATAVVTNGALDTQRGALEATGLIDLVDVVAASAEHGIAKPDPELFRIVLERLGVAADEAWHVGDRLADDVRGAQAAGVAAVWLDRSGGGVQAGDPVPDAVVRGLDDVARLIAAASQD